MSSLGIVISTALSADSCSVAYTPEPLFSVSSWVSGEVDILTPFSSMLFNLAHDKDVSAGSDSRRIGDGQTVQLLLD